MEKKMETTTMGYIGTTIRIHSFIPSPPDLSHARALGYEVRGGMSGTAQGTQDSGV